MLTLAPLLFWASRAVSERISKCPFFFTALMFTIPGQPETTFPEASMLVP